MADPVWYTCKCKECSLMDLKKTRDIKGVKKAYCNHFKTYEDPEHKACCMNYFKYNPKSKKPKESNASIGSLLAILVVIVIAALIVNFVL